MVVGKGEWEWDGFWNSCSGDVSCLAGVYRVITCVRNLTRGKCCGHYRINLPLSLPWVLFSSRHRHVSAGDDEVFDARRWQIRYSSMNNSMFCY